MGIIAASFDYEDGGLQIPFSALTSRCLYYGCCEQSFTWLCWFNARCSRINQWSLANKILKDMYVPNMLSGVWGGTMCLTEPQAGSSLVRYCNKSNSNR